MADDNKTNVTRQTQLPKRFTVNEALAIVENCNDDDDDASEYDKVNIYYEPPQCQVLTGEDSADKDGVIDNLSRKQLNASCTVTACNKKKTGKRNLFEVEAEEDNKELDDHSSTAGSDTAHDKDDEESSDQSSIADSENPDEEPSSSSLPATSSKSKRPKSSIKPQFTKEDLPSDHMNSSFTHNEKSEWVLKKDYTLLTMFEFFFR
ncbi:hypothetical protein ElyMa_003002900 [Elysia marginata]|uniref:Uncharacterized protein n=1 Tax=Elysia marginata TaxID=1093978 RepID=A0AAV4IH31_9GAST|nr:hypothetical protein ElyMa_003002900 [Elysia marginata]